MAEKRMFSKQIIDSDAFLDMPLSTQALYFHLSMRADDDGFIDNPRKIQRMVGASADDLKLLISKRYVLTFESGVIVIKHWRIHNTIQKDRYKETVYIEEKSSLTFKDNKAYTEKNHIVAELETQEEVIEETAYLQGKQDLDTDCKQNGNSLETQIRLDKNRLDKNSKDINTNVASKDASESDLLSDFEKLYSIYPVKKGKADAYKHFKAWLKGKKTSFGMKKLTKRQMWNAVVKYKKTFKDEDYTYMCHFSTFMNTKIMDYVEEENECTG